MKAIEMARTNVTFIALVALFCLGSLFMLANPLSIGTNDSDSASRHGGVTHIVMFQFKEAAAADAIAKTNRNMLALKNTCIDPVTQKPYIRSLTGGRDNSIEGLQNGISNAFVVEFDSPKMRDYYVKSDPTHKAFIKAAGAVLEKAIVVDFTDSVF